MWIISARWGFGNAGVAAQVPCVTLLPSKHHSPGSAVRGWTTGHYLLANNGRKHYFNPMEVIKKNKYDYGE